MKFINGTFFLFITLGLNQLIFAAGAGPTLFTDDCLAGDISEISSNLDNDKTYLHPISFPGQNWLISGIRVRHKRCSGCTGYHYQAGIVKVNTSDNLPSTSVLASCPEVAGLTGSGFVSTDCTLTGGDYTLKLNNTVDEKVGIVIQTDNSSFVRNVDNSNESAEMMVHTYAEDSWPDWSSPATGSQRLASVQIIYKPIGLSVPSDTMGAYNWNIPAKILSAQPGGSSGAVNGLMETFDAECFSSFSNPNSLYYDFSQSPPTLKRMRSAFVGAAATPPATAVAPTAISSAGVSIGHETSQQTFKNPRGQKYNYLVYKTSTNAYLYKSADAKTWSSSVTLSTRSNQSNSVWIEEDASNSRLKVHFVTGDSTCGTTDAASTCPNKIYYCLLTIADDASDPTEDCTTDIGSGGNEDDTGYYGANPNVAVDSNGYVHIGIWGNGVSSISRRVSIFGSTTTSPGSNPTWSAVSVLDDHSADGNADQNEVRILPFTNGTMGVIGRSYRDRFGINISSYNGTSYSTGTFTSIANNNNSSWQALTATVDSDDYIHFAYKRQSNNDLEYARASNVRDAENWPALSVLSDNIETATISSDPSGKVYVFYTEAISGETQTVKWRVKNNADASWSEYMYFVDPDADVDMINTYPYSLGGVIPLVYLQGTTIKSAFFNPQ